MFFFCCYGSSYKNTFKCHLFQFTFCVFLFTFNFFWFCFFFFVFFFFNFLVKIRFITNGESYHTMLKEKDKESFISKGREGANFPAKMVSTTFCMEAYHLTPTCYTQWISCTITITLLWNWLQMVYQAEKNTTSSSETYTFLQKFPEVCRSQFLRQKHPQHFQI